MILDLFRNAGFSVPAGVFLLPVGIGLLRARASSRRWATFWAGFMGGTLLLALVLVSISGGDVSTRFLGMELGGPVAGAFAIAVVAMCASVIWMLYTPPVSGAFTPGGRPGGRGRRER
jgi:hypothetical protein